jgi:hypothetical protein
MPFRKEWGRLVMEEGGPNRRLYETAASDGERKPSQAQYVCPPQEIGYHVKVQPSK